MILLDRIKTELYFMTHSELVYVHNVHNFPFRLANCEVENITVGKKFLLICIN